MLTQNRSISWIKESFRTERFMTKMKEKKKKTLKDFQNAWRTADQDNVKIIRLYSLLVWYILKLNYSTGKYYLNKGDARIHIKQQSSCFIVKISIESTIFLSFQWISSWDTSRNKQKSAELYRNHPLTCGCEAFNALVYIIYLPTRVVLDSFLTLSKYKYKTFVLLA